MTKIIEKDGYTFKLRIYNSNNSISYTIEVKKKFLFFYIWEIIAEYDSKLYGVIYAKADTIIERIRKKINDYIYTQNEFTEICNYLK